MSFSLVIPAFIAGIVMFLAPCTLPLVPGYLAFISGVSAHDATENNGAAAYVRKKMLVNALFYVLGFSLVFILLGIFLTSLGRLGLGHIRFSLEKISGGLILLLGLSMTRVFDLAGVRFLQKDWHLPFTRTLAPGKPLSSFLFGATFAFGWSPCIGPILGSILLLATTSGTVFEGALLLTVFSCGLAIPFFLAALGFSQATRVIVRLRRYLSAFSVASGALIALLGLLILTGNMGAWVGFFTRILGFVRTEAILKYL